MRKRTYGRECALQILYQFAMNPESLQHHFDDYWQQHPDTPEEVREFAEMLVRGTSENLLDIDQAIVRAAENWDLSRMAIVDRTILRFATYELLFVEQIPPKVTINEAVNIAKKFSQEESGKFVNGILDHISHHEKTRFSPSPDDPPGSPGS